MNNSESRYLNVFQILSNNRTALKKKAQRKTHRTEQTPTYMLYAQLQDYRAMLAIAEASNRDGFGDEMLQISDDYRDELRVRIGWLTNEINERLEKL